MQLGFTKKEIIALLDKQINEKDFNKSLGDAIKRMRQESIEPELGLATLLTSTMLSLLEAVSYVIETNNSEVLNTLVSQKLLPKSKLKLGFTKKEIMSLLDSQINEKALNKNLESSIKRMRENLVDPELGLATLLTSTMLSLLESVSFVIEANNLKVNETLVSKGVLKPEPETKKNTAKAKTDPQKTEPAKKPAAKKEEPKKQAAKAPVKKAIVAKKAVKAKK